MMDYKLLALTAAVLVIWLILGTWFAWKVGRRSALKWASPELQMKAEGDARGHALQAVFAIGLLITLVGSVLGFLEAAESQRQVRYARIMDDIGSTSPTRQLAAIYELQEITEKETAADPNSDTVFRSMQLLAQFIVEHAPRPQARDKNGQEVTQNWLCGHFSQVSGTRPTIAAAMRALGTLNKVRMKKEVDRTRVIPLTDTDLRNLDGLHGLNFQYFDFHACLFSGSHFTECDMRNSAAYGAFLCGADFQGAHFDYADLRAARVSHDTNFSGMSVNETQMGGMDSDDGTPPRMEPPLKGIPKEKPKFKLALGEAAGGVKP